MFASTPNEYTNAAIKLNITASGNHHITCDPHKRTPTQAAPRPISHSSTSAMRTPDQAPQTRLRLSTGRRPTSQATMSHDSVTYIIHSHMAAVISVSHPLSSIPILSTTHYLSSPTPYTHLPFYGPCIKI